MNAAVFLKMKDLIHVNETELTRRYTWFVTEKIKLIIEKTKFREVEKLLSYLIGSTETVMPIEVGFDNN